MFHPSAFLHLGPFSMPVSMVTLALSLLMWYVGLRVMEVRQQVRRSQANDQHGIRHREMHRQEIVRTEIPRRDVRLSKVHHQKGNQRVDGLKGVSGRKGIRRQEGWRLSDSFLTLVIMGLFLYKLWPIISHPSLLWTRGRALLFMAGGRYFQVGLFLLMVSWFIWQRFRYGVSVHMMGQHLFRAILPALALWSLLMREYGTPSRIVPGYSLQEEIYHPVNLYLLLFIILLMICLWAAVTRGFILLEPWLFFALSSFYLIISPIRMTHRHFLVFDGEVWAWVGFAVAIIWIVYAQTLHHEHAPG